MTAPVTISNRHAHLRPAHRPLERLASRVFSGERSKGHADIILAGSSVLLTLNRRFRKKNKTTDVLAFAFGGHGRPDSSGFWGEVYVNLDLLRREAKQTGLTLRDALAWRIVHGLLHLLGYDHRLAKEAAVMRERERKYLAAAGFRLPWEREPPRAEQRNKR